MKHMISVVMLSAIWIGQACAVGSMDASPPERNPVRWRHNPYSPPFNSSHGTATHTPPPLMTPSACATPSHSVDSFGLSSSAASPHQSLTDIASPQATQNSPWNAVVAQLQVPHRNHKELVSSILSLNAGDVSQDQFTQNLAYWLHPEQFGYLPLPLGVRLDLGFIEAYQSVMNPLNDLARDRTDKRDIHEKIMFYEILARYTYVALADVNYETLPEPVRTRLDDDYFDYRLGLANILGIAAAREPRGSVQDYNQQAFNVAHETLEVALQYSKYYRAGTCYLMMSRASSFIRRKDSISANHAIMDNCIERMPKECFDNHFGTFGEFIRGKDLAYIIQLRRGENSPPNPPVNQEQGD